MGLELFKTPLAADANLKAYYRMESGALTTDSSGNGKTLTNNNTIGEAAGIVFGGAADLGTANTNKYFSIADALSYVNGSAYSIACWVKFRTELTGDGDLDFIAGVGEAATDTFLQLFYQQTAGVKMVTAQHYKNGVGASGTKNFNVTLGTLVAHHIALVSAGTTLRVYVDGVDSGTVAISGNGTGGVSNGFFIGSNIGASQFANMYVDEIACFNRALTQAEITSLYQGDGWAASVLGLTNYRPRKRTTGAVSV